MSTSSLPSFIKIHQAVLEKKSKMWKVYGRTTTTTTTDGRTDDGRCAMTIAHSSLRLRWANKSPKGHWSLTWVQWALLLKVRFLSKSESMTAIFVKSVRTGTIAIFQFRIPGFIRFVAVAFRSEDEVLWRRNPSLTYFWQIAPPLDPPLGGVCRKAYKQVRDYEYFISIKFRKHPSSGSVGKADYVFQYIYMH